MAGAAAEGAAAVAAGAIAVPQLAQKRWPGPASAPHGRAVNGLGAEGLTALGTEPGRREVVRTAPAAVAGGGR